MDIDRLRPRYCEFDLVQCSNARSRAVCANQLLLILRSCDRDPKRQVCPTAGCLQNPDLKKAGTWQHPFGLKRRRRGSNQRTANEEVQRPFAADRQSARRA